MARKVFFSFHYEDVASFRANVVRNCSNFRTDNVGYIIDTSIWESAQTRGVAAIKTIIDEGLIGSSVTAVLIGPDTASRRWVKYEIFQSFARGNGLIGIHINRIKDRFGYITGKGENPFERLGIKVSLDGRTLSCYELVDGRWQPFNDLTSIPNRRSNTRYMADSSWLREGTYGKFFKLSNFFPVYCWDTNNGYPNVAKWVEASFEAAKTEYAN